MSELATMIDNKLSQWETERINNARRAIFNGESAELVQYPTGLLMRRFGEPYGSKYGMHFEIDADVWDALKAGTL